jgi:hypothetical protein
MGMGRPVISGLLRRVWELRNLKEACEPRLGRSLEGFEPQKSHDRPRYLRRGRAAQSPHGRGFIAHWRQKQVHMGSRAGA